MSYLHGRAQGGFDMPHTPNATSTPNYTLVHVTRKPNAGVDINGRSSMVWGVYGVPETFIIHKGTVIYKHIGPIHMNELKDVILPILGKIL